MRRSLLRVSSCLDFWFDLRIDCFGVYGTEGMPPRGWVSGVENSVQILNQTEMEMEMNICNACYLYSCTSSSPTSVSSSSKSASVPGSLRFSLTYAAQSVTPRFSPSGS